VRAAASLVRRWQGEEINAAPFVSAGCSQRFLDCGLHEIATGDRASVEHQNARLRIAMRLVEAGADPDNRQHGCGGTPLHHTLAGGYIELVKYLLTAQADVNASNRYGQRARARRASHDARSARTRGTYTLSRHPWLRLTVVAPMPLQVCTRCTLR
jgi:hypothetical protein